MRRLTLLLTLLLLLVAGSASAQCLPPACVNNIAGKVLMLAGGSAGVRLVSVQVDPAAPIDPTTAYLAWDFDPTETAQDANANGGLPCPTPFENILTCSLLTPTPLDAALMTYRVSTLDSSTVISPTVIMVANVNCSPAMCWTPPLIRILPNLGNGGSFVLRLSRETLPRFHESAWSEPVSFRTLGAEDPPPPPPPVCAVSEWQEWSPWAPFVPQVSPPKETRHRNRTITNAPCVGAPFLTETANRDLLVTPPVKTCTYMAPGSNVFQQRNVGDVIEGNNYSPQGRGQRMDQLFSWGWAVSGFPIRDQAGIGAHLKATCVGLP